MEIDHIEAKSEGGLDDPSNLQMLYSTCNRMKGTSSQSVFLAKTAHLRIGKSTEGIDFDSYKLETYSEHDWSFREAALYYKQKQEGGFILSTKRGLSD